MKLARKPPLITRAEWDFSGLSESEITAACYHEYLRETGKAFGIDMPWACLPQGRKTRLARVYLTFQKRGLPFEFEKDLKKILIPPAPFSVNNRGQVRIGWTYTDRELEKSFRRWLKINRPKSTRAKRSGDRYVNYHAALERLAITRLLHSYTPAELRKLPEWSAIKQNVIRCRDQFRERTNAIKFFQGLFPNPRCWNGKPRSWETATARARRQKGAFSSLPKK